MRPTFFQTAGAFRGWLEEHGEATTELLVGFYKKSPARQQGMTYAEALDEALCAGWIDGVRKGLDERRYTVRFTPRKAKSYWSAANLRHAERLSAAGRMRPPGLAELDKRDQSANERYSYEAAREGLDAASRAELERHPRAFAFFSAQVPSYQRTAGHWVVRAKQELTRQRRLAALIAACEKGEAIGPLKWAKLKPAPAAVAATAPSDRAAATPRPRPARRPPRTSR